jgi:lysyl-tRNA synthetase class I
VYRQAVILRGNNIYRFNVCNEKGHAVMRIYDNTNMLLSSYDNKSDKEYNPINFLCRKTGQYIIVITERDGKAGEAVGIMSHVTK